MINEMPTNKPKEASPREFGFVFTGFFTLITFLPLVRGNPLRWWSAPIAIIFLFLTLVTPQSLSPLAKVWMKFGLILHRVMSPIIMSIIYFLVFTPFSLLFKALGMKFLKLDFDKDTKTYWVKREQANLDQMSFKNQF